MNYGEYRRSKQRINVLRGYHGNESLAATRSAKPKASEGILSGMLISLDSNGEWIKGCPTTKEPYWAYHDQADTDVVSSGLLLGLSGAGQYIIETAYFDNGDTYANGDTLIVDGTTGGVQKGAALGTETGDVLGIVQGARNTTTTTNSEGGTLAGPNYSLTFRTVWIPHSA